MKWFCAAIGRLQAIWNFESNLKEIAAEIEKLMQFSFVFNVKGEKKNPKRL